MRPLTATAVFALFAAGLVAQEKAEKYESKAGKYTIAFPGGGKPTVQTIKASGVDLNMAIVEKGDGGFAVMFSDLPGDAAKLNKKDVLDGGQKGLVDTLKVKVTSSKDFKIGTHEAREIQAEKDAQYLRVQIILADNRLYQVFVIGSKAAITAKDADKFFESFEIAK